MVVMMKLTATPGGSGGGGSARISDVGTGGAE